MDHNKLPISEFNLGEMGPHPSICVIGKRGPGKTTLISTIINQLQTHHSIDLNIVSPIDRLDGIYKKTYPGSNIIHELNYDFIKEILSKASDKSKQIHYVIVLDDCVQSKSNALSDPTMQELLMNGRHYNITCILTMQYPMGLSPVIRCNFDYIFLFREQSTINKKKLYTNYCGMFPTYECFEHIFETITDNHTSMVIKNCTNKGNFNDLIFWFRAHVPEDPSNKSIESESESEADFYSDSGSDSESLSEILTQWESKNKPQKKIVDNPNHHTLFKLNYTDKHYCISIETTDMANLDYKTIFDHIIKLKSIKYT